MARSVSLVMPVYNGAHVLPERLREVRAWLAAQEGPTELLVVDDGSTDETPRILRDSGVRAHTFERNRGKGLAVREGLARATGDFRLFLDADLALPADNAAAIVAALDAGADVAIGSRKHPMSRIEAEPDAGFHLAVRTGFGRAFNLLARAWVVPGIRDTQAGIKGFSAAAVARLLPLCTVERFAFDVEMLFHARRLGLRIAEVPVRMIWRRGDSGLRLGRDGWRMATDLVRMRVRARRSRYDGTTSA